MKNDVECSFIFRFSKKFYKVEKPHVFFFGLVTEKSAFTGPKAAALTGENNIFKNYSQRNKLLIIIFSEIATNGQSESVISMRRYVSNQLLRRDAADGRIYKLIELKISPSRDSALPVPWHKLLSNLGF